MNKNTKTTEQFIKELKFLFKDFYDYSKVEYLHSKTNVHIICPLHGDSFKKPNQILSSGFACKKCGILSKTGTTSKFISKAKKIHNNLYNYSRVKYVNSYTPVMIGCNRHNYFTSTLPSTHLKGYFNCPECKIKSTEQYIKDAVLVHKNLYDYSLVEYTGALNKIKIICKHHGIFEQSASTHLSGSGCSSCNCYNGYTKDKFIDLCNKRYEGLSNFYIIKLQSNLESFYKIGITCRKIDDRYKRSNLNSYTKEDILFIENLTPALTFDLEKYIISSFKEYKYLPKDTSFDGKTECINYLPKNYREIIDEFIFKNQE